MKKNLILTIATNYSYNKLAPFVTTLKKINFTGDVILFYDNLSEKTAQELKNKDVKLIKFDSQKIQKKDAFLVNYRFNLFYDFLKKNIKKYNLVFLTDVRDLIFQIDPFRFPNYGKINFFLEDTKIKDSKSNCYTLTKSKGTDAFEKYKNNYISCAGTTLGRVDEILKYLKYLKKNLNREGNFDQGLHNYIVHSKIFPYAKVFKNFQGPVLTIGNLKNKDILYNSKGEATNKNEEVVPVIHQFDRIPKLLYKFNTPINFLFRYSEAWYIKFKIFSKKVLFNTPLIKGYFKKRYYNPLYEEFI